MATLLCNNNGNGGLGQKSKGYYATLFRGRKTAFRSKPAKGIIKIKKTALPEEIISSSHKEERKRDDDCWDSWDQIVSLEKKKNKRIRVSNSTTTTSSRDLISDCASVDELESLAMIKEGSYGAVYKVRDKQTGEIMAMKEEMEGLSRTTLTEIDILKSLEPHPNVVGFKKVAADESGGVYVLMELMETDLRSCIAALNKEEEEEQRFFAIDEVKMLMKQLLEGVKFLHQNSVMHRDLKPENILLSRSGDLKICDFGLSTRFSNNEEGLLGSFSPRVGTLWYKAPELLRGVDKYSTEVDMWAVGCIMAELVLNKVLFEGEDEEDQLHRIYWIVGSPNNSNKICSSLILSANERLSEAGFDLLKGLLSYDPRKRTTAEAALNHDWFLED